MESRKSKSPNKHNDAPIEEFLKVLYEHKKSALKEGKFDEAEQTMNRIKELMIEEEKRKKKEIKEKI